MLQSFTTFGDLFKYLRKRARLTQQALGTQVGYSTTTINRYEHNQQLPDAQAIHALFVAPLGLKDDPAALKQLLHLLQHQIEANAANDIGNHAAAPQTPAPAPIAAPPPSNSDLPIPPTEIIGRDNDIAQVLNYVRKHRGRLVTLVGPPGVGKSRLALEIASQFSSQACPAKFISCATIVDAAQFLPVLLSVFNIALPNADGRSAFDTLTRHLRDQHMLIVLDNLEQLLGQDTVPRQIANVLAACPRLYLVATSREALQIRAEQVLAVQPLSARHAVALFENRAQAADPEFTLTAQNSPIVAQICQRLDHLPLAIELMASRVMVNSPQQILAALAQPQTRLLHRGAADLPERHRTLHNAITWSYQLLSQAQQAAFRCLGCFSGAFSAQAAVSLGCSNDDLNLFVRQNLIKRNASQPEPYFILLNSLTEFAQARLHEHGEWHAKMTQHLSYYLALVEENRPHLTGPDRHIHMQRLNYEHYNLMAAMDWALAQHNSHACYQFIYALGHFWEYQVYNRQVLPWLKQVYALTSPAFNPSQPAAAQQHADICRGASVAAWQADDLQLAVEYGLRSLAFARISEQPVALIYALETAAFLMSQTGVRISEAKQLFDESWQMRELWRNRHPIMPPRINPTLLCDNADDFAHLCMRYEHDLPAWRAYGNLNYIGLVLYVLGDAWACLKNDANAETYYQESLSVSTLSRHKQRISWANYGLGCVLQRQGRLAAAETHLAQAYALFEEAGNELAMFDCFLARHVPHTAPNINAQLLGAYQTRLRAKRLRVFPIEQLHYEFLCAQVRASLSAAEFEHGFSIGERLNMDEALALLMPAAHPQTPPA